MQGRFITLEGGEGAGKSTQVTRLLDWLKSRGTKALATREPGGTPGAEEIRNLLVNGGRERWDAWSEALLLYAARRDHVTKVIAPALQSGTWVLSDRFADSTMAYQGFAGELGEGAVAALHRLVLGRFQPDLTLILDLPAEMGLQRSKNRGGAQRFESFDLAFHEKLRRGFLSIAAQEPQRCAVIDATRPLDEVTDAVRQIVQERLG